MNFDKFLFWAVDSKGKIGMGVLSQRMAHNFCAGICATSCQWKTI